MKLKNLFTIMLVLMASFSVTFAASDGTAIISASLLSQTPNPAEAGDSVELKFSIENVGWETSDYLSVTIKEGFPFEVVGDNEISIGKLTSGDDYKQLVKYEVKIEADAKAGSHDLTLVVTDSKGLNKEFDFTIDIESQDSIEILSIDKSVIGPGSQEELNFKIKNVGSADLENLKFSLASEENVLLPVLSDNSYHIDSLKSGEEILVPFKVIASSTVIADLYSLDLKINYQDSMTGTTKEVTTTAGIYIGGVTEFDIVFDDEVDGEYAFTIANIGSNDATSVKVSVQDSSTWQVNGRSSEIIGNLNSGDYTTTSFEMVNGRGNLNFEIEYTDTMGVRQITQKEVEVEVQENNTLISGDRSNMPSGEGAQKARGPMGGLATAGAGLADLAKNVGIGIIVIVVGILDLNITEKGSHLKNKDDF